MNLSVLKPILDLIVGILSRRASTVDTTSTSKKSPVPTETSPEEAGLSLVLTRDVVTEDSTGGKLYVDGVFECYTLEDRCRLEEGESKVPGLTAIPVGTYPVILSHSPRFGRILPLLENVPGFEGVRIHPGNKPEDTDGCILVGRIRGPNQIAESRLAFDALFAKLQEAESAQIKIQIEIS